MDIIGNVTDEKGIVTMNMRNKKILVKSICRNTQSGVSFCIAEVVNYIKMPNDKPKVGKNFKYCENYLKIQKYKQTITGNRNII